MVSLLPVAINLDFSDDYHIMEYDRVALLAMLTHRHDNGGIPTLLC